MKKDSRRQQEFVEKDFNSTINVYIDPSGSFDFFDKSELIVSHAEISFQNISFL